MSFTKMFFLVSMLSLWFVITSCGNANAKKDSDEVASEQTRTEQEPSPAHTQTQEKASYNEVYIANEMAKYQLGDVMEFRSIKLKEFLNDPSMDTLIRASGSFSVYRRKESQVERISSPDILDAVARSGGFRSGNWPVYVEFIDFMNDPENFEKILLEHDIEEEIISYVIIVHGQLIRQGPASAEGQPQPSQTPGMSIWIHTDNGNYFLEQHNYINDPDWKPGSTDFTYIFHDLASFTYKCLIFYS